MSQSDFENQLWTIVFVILIAIFITLGGVTAQDHQMGAEKLFPAVVREKIYKPAVDDTTLIPLEDGTTLTLDNSTSSKFTVLLSLEDMTTVKINVRKQQFKSLSIGESINLRRWVGRSGRIYQQSILTVDS